MPAARPEADSPEVLALLHEGLAIVPFVVGQAARHTFRFANRDDLEAYAREGALLAARSFDPARGVPFRRWASIRMRGALVDGVRRAGDLPRRVHERLRAVEAQLASEEAMAEEDVASPPATAEAADARLDDYLAAMATSLASGSLFTSDQGVLDRVEDEAPTPEEQVEQAELSHYVREALGELDEKERTILENHFLQGMTLEQAGASMGLSRSWACRLHARAMTQITKALKRRWLDRIHVPRNTQDAAADP